MDLEPDHLERLALIVAKLAGELKANDPGNARYEHAKTLADELAIELYAKRERFVDGVGDRAFYDQNKAHSFDEACRIMVGEEPCMLRSGHPGAHHPGY